MSATTRPYVPPAGNTWSLPLYDPLARLMGADRFRALLLDQAELRAGHRVLDLGCGTGTLLVALRARHPDVEAVGIDPDPGALATARRKADRAGVTVQLDPGYADALPYPDRSFDRVFSSFMLHHLDPDVKRAALGEVRRVLRPGGALHLVDFGGPGEHRFLARLLHRRPRLADQLGDGVITLLRGCGFDAAELHRHQGWSGPLVWVRARVSGG